ncbi:MAG: hypothetical protein QM610_01470 [Chitinophagaceae bacterium]
MKRLYCFFLIFPIAFLSSAQKTLQTVHYHIDATLDANARSIDGQWEATYVNHADSTLHTIWIMLYPNAFASDRTNYSEELLKWGNMRYYFGKQEHRGRIDSLAFVVNKSDYVVLNANKKDYPECLPIELEQPLLAGDSVRIATTFFTRLPYNFENNGYNDDGFIMDAWCPLVAELNNNGWQLQPYSLWRNNYTAAATFSVKLSGVNGFHIVTNGNESSKNEFQYSGSDGFKWMAYRDKDGVKRCTFEKNNLDSVRTVVAKRIFPEVLKTGKAPEKPAQWLGNVYKKYQRPIPFLTDSLYWKDGDSLKLKQLAGGDSDHILKLGFLYDFRDREQYKYLFLSPALGFNNYDKLMVGALVHNYQLPQVPFSFVLAPMYGTGSKRFSGWGKMDYHIWGPTAHWQVGVTGNTFSMNEFNIPYYPKFYQRLWRVVPSVNVTLLDKEAASTKKWDLGLRAFILSQQRYNYYATTTDTGFNNLTMCLTLFQFNAQLQDTRKLYPYSVSGVADAGKDFMRIGLTGKYFFNYDASGQGVSARLFVGKFFYLKYQTSLVEANNQIYNFSLGGPSGVYDYTYSDYFVGRNETTGWMSQQIMERDGFFKVPMMAFRGVDFGMGDNWLSALNLTADIPNGYNILKTLNGTIKLFFDVGTYAGLWSDVPPAGRFLYDAGVQVSLCRSLVNVYVPLLYSNVFRDRFKSMYSGQGYLWKTLSFNINLAALQPRNRNSLWPQ